MNKLFEELRNMEGELYSLHYDLYNWDNYWCFRHNFTGHVERIAYKIFKKGNKEEKSKIINKLCEFYFSFNINIYVRYLERYQVELDEQYHFDYLQYPTSKIESKNSKGKEIITEYYLLGQKIYNTKNQFMYGFTYGSCGVFNNEPYGYMGEPIQAKLQEMDMF